MLFKDDGVFDEEGALNNLIEIYGQEKEVVKVEDGAKKKRKTDTKEPVEGATEEDTETSKKVKLSESVKVMKNHILYRV